MRSGRWGDVCTLEYGKALRNTAQEPSDVNQYPVYGTNGPIGWTSRLLCSEPGIIIGRKGAYRGVRFSRLPFFVIDTAFYLRPNVSDLHVPWAYYKLLTVDINSIDVGAAIPTTNRDVFYSVPLDLPPIETQRRIADILSAYDDLIENNRRRMALLEKAAQMIYREWFVRLRFPGNENVRVVDGVPEGWERCAVKDVGQVVTGKTPSTKSADNYGEDIPFVKTPDMHGNLYVTETAARLSIRGAESQKNKFIPAGSVMVSCIGTIGVVSIAPEPCQTNQQINSLIPSDESDTYYCYYALKSLKDAMEALGGGATMPNVNKNKFESLDMLWPDADSRATFGACCAPLFRQILNLQLQNLKLQQARDILLPKLMSGELDVAELEMSVTSQR